MSTFIKDEDVIKAYLSTQQNDYFEELYRRYVNKVYRRCLSLTKDTSQAEDFTQDIFLRVFSSLDRFKEKSSFSTWLYSISYNYCMDQLRRSSRTPLVPLDDQYNDYVTDQDDAWTIEMHHQALNQAMATMHPEEIQVLRLKYEEGLNIEAIAQRINVRDTAVKMRLKRTRDKLRKKCMALAA